MGNNVTGLLSGTQLADVDKPVSHGPTVGNDFVHSSHTGVSSRSAGEFVALRRPRQLGHPVENPGLLQ